MDMKKRGMQLAISTIILMILGLLVLIGLTLMLTGAGQKLLDAIKDYSGSEIDNLKQVCESQCNLNQEFGFCCEEKELEGEVITCQDKRIDIECEIKCESICII